MSERVSGRGGRAEGRGEEEKGGGSTLERELVR